MTPDGAPAGVDELRPVAAVERATSGDAADLPSDVEPGRPRGPLALLRRLGPRTLSSLTRRIVLLNMAGLVALVLGILYLNQFREGLIDSRVQALLTQGEIMAGAIASSATVETGGIRVDPDRLLDGTQDQDAGTADEDAGSDELGPLDFPINPERVAPLLRRLVAGTGLRARIYDRDGNAVLDTRTLVQRGDMLRQEPPPTPPAPGALERAWTAVKLFFSRSDLPLYQEIGSRNGKAYGEVATALQGTPATVARVDERGESIVSVAVPVQRLSAVRGVLLLSTTPGDIDHIVGNERLAILRVFAVAAAVMLVLSLLLAGTIAGPVRRLAEAAERVRHGVTHRQEIPDFSGRSDEIGHLSGALRDMTEALYSRIEAIESFAADVSHELKNPLTSLRSAVETLPLARTETSRNRLMEVIQHDVRRLDRLISDISDASRLDAELQRGRSDVVDLVGLLNAVASAANGVDRGDGVQVRLSVPLGLPETALLVTGHESRLGQVVTNLVDNARSFSPVSGAVALALRRVRQEVEITVEDSGPGVPDHALQRIFERFYTDRPEEQGFGQNSGLGLSISRQIVEAHGGRIWAENRHRDGRCLGARFVVRLPAAA